jgi:large repetitive protein
MIFRLTAALLVVLTSVLAVTTPAPAAHAAVLAAGTDFQRVFSAQDNGAIALFGNTLMSCPSSQSGCAQARDGSGTKLNNNDWSMSWVHADGDPSTYAASSSDVILPEGSTVLWAGLYWGGDRAASGNTAARSMKLRAPGGSYQSITAQRFLTLSNTTSGPYQGFADVTARVRAGGTGTWWGADVVSQAARSDEYAGWSLVVAYRNPALPLRDLTVFDGFTQITTRDQQTLNISGFLTPPTGPVKTQLGVIAYEGDLGLTGDQMKLNDVPLQDQVVRPNNFFDSGNTALGRLVTTRNPDYRNMLGYDVKLIQADGILPNGSTSARIGLTTAGDVYYPGVVTAAIDLYSPQFPGETKSVVDLDGHAPVQPGDALQYTVVYTNTGQDAATGSVVSDPLPAGVSYVPGSLEITAGANAGKKTDAPGDDQGEYDPSTRTVRMRIGTGANATRGGTMDPGASTTFVFRARVDRDAGGTTLINATTIDYVAKTIGKPFQAVGYPVDTPVAREADLALVKSVSPNPAAAGGQLHYTLDVTNHGPSSAAGTVLTDTLPAGVTFVSATPSGACTAAGQTVTCRLGTLADGAKTTVDMTAAVATSVPAGPLTNIATVTSSTPDPDLANNTTGTTGTIAPLADVSLAKTASPATAVAGENVVYTLTARNAGPSDAAGLAVTDPIPVGTTFVSASSGCAAAGGVVTCRATSATAAGTERSFTVTLKLDPGFTGNRLVNTASVTSTTPDPDTANNTASASVPVTMRSDLTITKAASSSSFVPGTAGTYLIRVTNNGPSNADEVRVQDHLPSGLQLVDVSTDHGPCTGTQSGTVACGLGTIGVGVTVLVTVNVWVSADAAPGTITNTATVSWPSGTKQATAGTPVVGSADLAITKSADPARPVPGRPVTYTMTVVNNGPSDAHDVAVTDSIPAGLTVTSVTASQGTCDQSTVRCTLGTMANGATATMTVVADVATGTTVADIQDTATVTSSTADPDTSNNQASYQSSLNPQANLEITKQASPDTAIAGDHVTYTLTVTNHGPSTASAVTVSDPLATGLTLVSASGSGATCTGTTAVSCTLGDLPDGETRTVTVDTRLAADFSGSVVRNTATVDSPTEDPTHANRQATAVTPVTTKADMEITKTGTATVVAGDTASYTIRVRNAGPSDAQNVAVSDPLPEAFDGVTATASNGATCVVGTPNLVSCPLGTVPAGGDVTITVTGTVRSSTAAGTLTNTARVSTSTPDPDSANDQASARTTVTTHAALTVVKTADPDPVVAGSRVVYQIQVRNAGPSDATNVTVTDPLPAGAVYESAQPSIGTCQGGLTCTAVRLPAGGTMTILVTAGISPDATGTLTNTATATTDDGPQASGTVTTPVDVKATLLVTKTATPEPVVAGSAATYKMVVTNQGPSTARSVVLSDALPAGVEVLSVSQDQGSCDTAARPMTCQLGDVSPSESIAVVAIVRIAPDTVAGSVTNSVSVTSASTTTPATAQVTSTVTQEADLSIAKTSPVTQADAGTRITYLLTINQQGPSTAPDVRVTDPLPSGLHLVSATPSAGTCAPGATVTCDLGTLEPGAIATVAIVADIDPAVAPGPLANTASVESAVTDPDPDNNESTLTLPIEAIADLSVTKTAAPHVVAPGELVTYTMTVKNAGPSVATATVLQDPLPLELDPATVTPSTPECGIRNTLADLKTGRLLAPTSSQALLCNFGNLPPGEERVVTVTARVRSDARAKDLINTADVGSSVLDPHLADNQATAVVILAPKASLTLTKTAMSAHPVAGGTLTWRFTATNTGPSDVFDAVVTDALPRGVSFLHDDRHLCSAAGSTLTCRIGHIPAGGSSTVEAVTRLARDVDAALENTARVTASGAAGATARAHVKVEPAPPLTGIGTGFGGSAGKVARHHPATPPAR